MRFLFYLFSCKPNVIDRSCDKCKPGHWRFPQCQECACDLRGTTLDICDPETSVCLCKQNVHGQACDLCKEGKFHISESNPKGCTECFCFGKSSRCSSSNLYLSQVLFKIHSHCSLLFFSCRFVALKNGN